MKRPQSYMRILPAAALGLVLGACARMGRPQGGERDFDPPRFVRSNPAPGSVNVDRSRIIINFDENIQLDDPMNKIVVSPAQKNTPQISGVGHRVSIELRDSLIPNTTYTVDFTDAIKDLNEGNILDGFSFDFSTGPEIDTLSISGMVFQAENLEPAQGMLVGVYSNLSDTAIRTLPFERITKTNQLGQFTVRNLKPGTYRIYAVNDVNRDFHWDRSEDVAFFDTTLTPTAVQAQHTDTIFSANGDVDSVFTHAVTEFKPDNVLLTWFNENYKAQYLMDRARPEANRITLNMGAPSDTLPLLRMLGCSRHGENIERWAVLNASPTRDTLEYWITDSAVILQDTIMLEARYQRTDSLDRLSWTTDTLVMNLRGKKRDRKNDTERAKKGKNDGDTAKAPEVPVMKVTVSSRGSVDVYAPIALTFERPLARLDTSAVRLEILEDSTWYEVERPVFRPSSPLDLLHYAAPYEWEPGQKYRLTVDSLGMTDIYGVNSGTISEEFTVKNLNEYANLSLAVTGLDGRPAVAELLSRQDAPVRRVPVVDGHAVFSNITPGDYFARLFIDANGNGKYDTGILDSIQPEEVYYYPKKIALKKNWDVDQTWDINELPIDQQKPQEIKKNKPKNSTGPQEDEYEDDQYYDEFGNPAVDPDDPFGKRKGKNRDSNYNRNSRFGGGGLNGNTGMGTGGRMRGGGVYR